MIKVLAVSALLMFCLLPTQAGATVLAGSKWGSAAGDKRTVHFGKGGRISGHAGCNRFFGSYEASKGTIRVGQLGATRKFCGEAAMKRERQWMGLLRAARTYEIQHTKLLLKSANGAVLARLKWLKFD